MVELKGEDLEGKWVEPKTADSCSDIQPGEKVSEYKLEHK